MGATESAHHEVWESTFSSEQQELQMEEDKQAWAGIIGILLAIVTFGVTLAAVVVWGITAWGA